MGRNVVKLLGGILIAGLVLILFTGSGDPYAYVYAQTGGGSLGLSPTTVTLTAGQQQSINVTVNTGGAQSSATDLVLTYNPAVFTIVDIVPGSAYSQYVGKAIDNAAGKANISGLKASGEPLLVGAATFATIQVQGVAQGTSDLAIDFTPGNLNDSNIADFSSQTNPDVLASVTNSTITVQGAGGVGGNTGGGNTGGGNTGGGTGENSQFGDDGDDDDDDFDNDGKDDKDEDDDDDDDGIKDKDDDDDDNDGIKDDDDDDDDNDGIPDSVEQDDDEDESGGGSRGAVATTAGIVGLGALAAGGLMLFRNKNS